MLSLLILRHAKSSWKHAGLDDHDRPLNRRGKEAAQRMGELLLMEQMVPDLIISSTATRAVDTAQLVMQHAEYEGDLLARRELYLAEPEAYVEVAQKLGGSAARLMLVGHNPGLEDLVGMLSGRSELFPTAALACFDVGVPTWRELQLSPSPPAKLIKLVRPKELGPVD